MNDFRDRQILLRACILAAAVFILSCTPNHFSNDKDAVPIEFASDFQVELRSSDRSGGFLKDDRIGVLAYYVPSGEVWDEYKAVAKPDFMYNVPLSYDGTSWSYSPVMYWPQAEGASLNFYVYSPYSDGMGTTGVKLSKESDSGEPSFEFILNESADVDLMVAENEGSTAADGPVELRFKHVLGKLQFRFNVSVEDGFSYIVDKIKVLNTPKTAVYDWNSGTFDVQTMASIEVSSGEDGGSFLIDSTSPVLIDDFTMYLMPGDMHSLEVTVNNEVKSVDLSDYEIIEGKVLSLNMEIDVTGIQFTTSVTDWVTGGEASGDIS